MVECMREEVAQPVINFLLAKLAFNAEIYTFDDWTRGYKKRPKGKKIHFVVQTADGASLLNGGTAGENRSKELNAWETCIFYCDKLAAEGYGLEENEIFNSSTYARLLREHGGSHLEENGNHQAALPFLLSRCIVDEGERQRSARGMIPPVFFSRFLRNAST